jgi:hypothetical protein
MRAVRGAICGCLVLPFKIKTLGVLTYWKKNDDGDFDEIEAMVGVNDPDDGEWS